MTSNRPDLSLRAAQTLVACPLTLRSRSTRSGNWYAMKVTVGNAIQCTCPAGARLRVCRHVTEAAEWLRSEGVVVGPAADAPDPFARFERVTK